MHIFLNRKEKNYGSYQNYLFPIHLDWKITSWNT
nr:MAG TPA: hypothetical protein [Bacteriophage sp.]